MSRLLIIFVSIILVSCAKDPIVEDQYLDGDVIFDVSLYEPHKYLVSERSTIETNKPVIITCHGYTATTFEWQEFKDYVDTNKVLVSSVLLGGHGRGYQTFKEATWLDWQQSIKDEIEALENLGYTNINIVGSSTGGALILDLLSEGYFNNHTINELLMVDPIVNPSNKMIGMVHYIGPMVGYLEMDDTDEERPYWYHYRPQETIRELHKLILKVRRDLAKGIDLPEDSRLKVYKASQDESADPVSAVLINKGIDGSEIEMIESNLHVMTRIEHRTPEASSKDYENQQMIFDEMIERVLE